MQKYQTALKAQRIPLWLDEARRNLVRGSLYLLVLFAFLLSAAIPYLFVPLMGAVLLVYSVLHTIAAGNLKIHKPCVYMRSTLISSIFRSAWSDIVLLAPTTWNKTATCQLQVESKPQYDDMMSAIFPTSKLIWSFLACFNTLTSIRAIRSSLVETYKKDPRTEK